MTNMMLYFCFDNVLQYQKWHISLEQDRVLWNQYDQSIRGALSNILNLKLIEESVWNQCTLPVKDGGLGIRSAQDLSLPAFLSSYTASIQIAHSMLPYGLRDVHSSYFDIGCNQWMNNLGITEIREYSNFQSEWDKPICSKKIQNMIGNAQLDADKARLRSILSDGTSAWFNVLQR